MEYSAIEKFILTIFFCGKDKDSVKDKKEGNNLLYSKDR